VYAHTELLARCVPAFGSQLRPARTLLSPSAARRVQELFPPAEAASGAARKRSGMSGFALLSCGLRDGYCQISIKAVYFQIGPQSRRRSVEEEDRTRAVRSLLRVVKEPGNTGMGFLTARGCIITAAHCIPAVPDVMDPRPKPVSVTITDLEGQQEETAHLCFFDYCTDVAVLSLDRSAAVNPGQESRPIIREGWLAHRKCLSLNRSEVQPGEQVTVHVYTTDRKWIVGITEVSFRYEVKLEAQFPQDSGGIPRGTSGAPVFDDRGRVFAIVSNSDADLPSQAGIIRLAMALPPWLLRQIR